MLKKLRFVSGRRFSDALGATESVRLQPLWAVFSYERIWKPPEPQLPILRELAAALLPVSKDPQSGIKTLPDRRIMALFTGPSGTGKTMAAEVLARELRLGLYRIDLTRVVSNYIGETEKNLSRILAEAAPKGAILFFDFDEADALFGKRSEVKDSHDRYTNLEVNYFLQRAEEHRGLVILATKTPHELAPAWPPRIDFIVQFSLPDAPASAKAPLRAWPFVVEPAESTAPPGLTQPHLHPTPRVR